jgi:FkbM family methyltransferase
MTRTKLTFEELDAIPYYTETGETVDTISRERTEQILANKYIESHHKVLELGGRYGTVSCIINNKLDNPEAHVVVEPDERVIDILHKNKDTHNSFFHVFQGVISNKKYNLTNTDRHFGGYGSTCVEDEQTTILSKNLNEVMAQYNVQFNCLFADCEGFLENFVRENAELVKEYELIIYEIDYPQKCDYVWIESFLKENNFECVEKIDARIPHCVWRRNDLK